MLDLLPSHWTDMDAILVGSVICLFVGFWVLLCINRPRSNKEGR
jgi:hypothetical protein